MTESTSIQARAEKGTGSYLRPAAGRCLCGDLDTGARGTDQIDLNIGKDGRARGATCARRGEMPLRRPQYRGDGSGPEASNAGKGGSVRGATCARRRGSASAATSMQGRGELTRGLKCRQGRKRTGSHLCSAARGKRFCGDLNSGARGTDQRPQMQARAEGVRGTTCARRRGSASATTLMQGQGADRDRP